MRTLLSLCLIVILLVACAPSTPPPPTATPAPTVTPLPTPDHAATGAAPTATAQAAAGATATGLALKHDADATATAAEATRLAGATATARALWTDTPTPTFTVTPRPTATRGPSATPRPTNTPVPPTPPPSPFVFGISAVLYTEPWHPLLNGCGGSEDEQILGRRLTINVRLTNNSSSYLKRWEAESFNPAGEPLTTCAYKLDREHHIEVPVPAGETHEYGWQIYMGPGDFMHRLIVHVYYPQSIEAATFTQCFDASGALIGCQ
jgi:hypothetical protein